MHPKQYITLGIAIIVLGAGFYFSELKFLSYSNTIETASSAQATSTAVFRIGGNSYPVIVSQGETVMEAMRALQSAGNLTFTGKDYPGMGFFVESINGRKNSNDLYWILYVNGKSASAGASQTIVKAGDNIEWRYEKGY